MPNLAANCSLARLSNLTGSHGRTHAIHTRPFRKMNSNFLRVSDQSNLPTAVLFLPFLQPTPECQESGKSRCLGDMLAVYLASQQLLVRRIGLQEDRSGNVILGFTFLLSAPSAGRQTEKATVCFQVLAAVPCQLRRDTGALCLERVESQWLLHLPPGLAKRGHRRRHSCCFHCLTPSGRPRDGLAGA